MNTCRYIYTYTLYKYKMQKIQTSDKANAEIQLGNNVWEVEGKFVSLGPEKFNLIREHISRRERIIKLSLSLLLLPGHCYHLLCQSCLDSFPLRSYTWDISQLVDRKQGILINSILPILNLSSLTALTAYSFRPLWN